MLAPRAALNCHSTAFQKVVRLDPAKLKTTNDAGVKLLVETLGGVWGQSTLENRFERFERAIFSTTQRHDETHESYLARHEVQFEDLLSQGVTLSDVRAYILLRNSGLNADDKRRVIVEANGDLTYPKVTTALKLLGSRFFQEVQTGSKQSSRNTYDINFTQDDNDVDWSTGETELHPIYHAAVMEDYAYDILQNEGDEDALIISQFEDQVLETLQNDPEVSSCFNVYLEARKRLSEKIKHRGFWTPSKGYKGRGKGKGKPFFGRRTLEQRIATSRRKICNQVGHWKNECPQKDKPSSSSQHGAFAGVAAMTTADLPPDFFDEHEPPEDAVAFTVQDSGFRLRRPVVDQKNSNFSQGYDNQRGYDNRNDIDHHDWSTQSLGRIASRLHSVLSRKHEMKSPSITPRPLSPEIPSSPQSELAEEIAHFASCGASGIVDLGASLSVIGNQQFKDLCQYLPSSILSLMKEAPCSVNFRFGNSSTVHGNRAVFIPLGHMWMKVIVVPSDTPFLIANSVFRKLGAVIDTQHNTIHFRELKCTVPISLSDRRLYMLDLLELIQNIPDGSICGAKPTAQTVCQCITEVGKDSNQHSESYLGEVRVNQNQEKSQTMKVDSISQATDEIMNSQAASLSRSETPLVKPASCDPVNDHGSEVESGLHQPFGKVQPPSLESGAGGIHRDNPGPELRGPQGLSHELRNGKEGDALLGSGSGCSLCHLVHQHIPEQSEGPTLSSPPLHPTARGTDGAISDSQTQVEGQSQSLSYPQEDLGRAGIRVRGPGGARWPMGASESHGTCDRRDAEPHGSDGECFATSTSTPESQGELNTTSLPVEDESSILEECLKTLHLMSEHLPEVIDADYVHEFQHPPVLQSNWVAKEMWDYLASKPESSRKDRRYKTHLLEIYCSQDSQLTHQATLLGLKARRFSLKDGDLSTQAGRFKLYDRLDQDLPLRAWLSPKCRAWCRWSTLTCINP